MRVLLIDDDVRLQELLRDYLQQNGASVTLAPDGKKGLEALDASGPFDVVLLDVMMPGIDGLETCRRMRQRSNVPIVMLTAKGDEADRVAGLEIGADDYVPKPFSPRELLARIRAVLRRARPDAEEEPQRILVGDLVIDTTTREVFRDGNRADLTGIEFDILVALARRPGRVIARDTLLAKAGRGDVTVGERTVDVHISRLRKKLGDDPPTRIRTVRGVGYVLSRSEDA
jgi:DNA-binding response OmpR family regulator